MSERAPGRRPLVQYGAEALTIVVGILLALAADAGWSWFGDRADEARLIDGLREEFAEAEREITADMASRERTVAITDSLLDAGAGSGVASLADAEAMSDLMNWRFYTPAHPFLDDALSSGRIELIRSGEIRRAIMAYVQERERIKVFDDEERAFVSGRLEPFMVTRLSLERLRGLRGPDAVTSELGRLLELTRDQEFRSLLFLRRERSEQGRSYGANLRDTIRGVRDALGPS